MKENNSKIKGLYKRKFTREELISAVYYNPSLGIFIFLKDYKNNKKYSVAGKKYSTGYVYLFGHTASNLAFLYMTGRWPYKGLIIDHKNRIKYDDRWNNLREVDYSMNTKNRDKFYKKWNRQKRGAD